jgi:hypothetical protein
MTASLVLEKDWTLSATTGFLGSGTPVAAMAEQIAYLFWLVLTFLCHLLQVLVGGESLKRSLVEIYLKNYIVTKTESVQH